MFYPELSSIKTYNQNSDLILEMDKWFATLTRNARTKISSAKLANTLGIDYYIARDVLEECVEIGLLKKKYVIVCPDCDHHLIDLDRKELAKALSETIFCIGCEDNINNFTLDDILIQYELVKKPSNPNRVKGIIEKRSNRESEKDSLKKLIDDGKASVNELFYDPTAEEYEHLKTLYNHVFDEHKTTKEKGGSLEELADYLFRLIFGFSVTCNLRSPTNEIDVAVKNNCIIKSTIYDIFGLMIMIECKNEKKKPDNNYYNKLRGIMNTTTTCHFGIIFSVMPITSTCRLLARDYLLKDKVFMISIDHEDIKKIIFEKYNILDLITDRVFEIDFKTTKDVVEDQLFSAR